VDKLLNFKELLSDIKTVLELPLKYALLYFDFLLLVLFLYMIGIYGFYAIIGLIISQTGIIYLIVKEIWRTYHMLPRSEAFETSPEKWKKAFEEYEKLVEKH